MLIDDSFPYHQSQSCSLQFSGLSNRHKFNFPDLDVSIRNHFMWVQDVNLHLTIKKLRNHCRQQWHGRVEYASAMIFIRRFMPEALLMEIPHERGFHGSLAHFYGPSNHERYCPKHTLITSMNEYNSKVYKSG